VNSAAISFDGKRIAYSQGGSLWIRDLARLEHREIPGTGDIGALFWSPDGAWVGYGSDGKLWKVPAAGGEPAVLCDLPEGRWTVASGGAWTPDGRIVFTTGESALLEVGEAGGEAVPFLELQAGEPGHGHVSAMPYVRGYLYTVRAPSSDRQEAAPSRLALVSGDSRKLFDGSWAERVAHPVYSPTGHILFQSPAPEPGIWAVPFNLTGLEATGEPFMVAPRGERPAVAGDGTLVYLTAPGGGHPRRGIAVAENWFAETAGGDRQAAIAGGDATDPETILEEARRARARQRFVITSQPPPPGLDRGFVQVGDGEIYYEMAGEGPDLVMIHGGWIDHRMWAPQVTALSSDFRVLCYDVRGHGLSSRTTDPPAYHEDLAELLTRLGIERAAVMGLSMGGIVAIDFAIAHPDRVTALIPVAPGLSGYTFPDPAIADFGRELNAAFGTRDYTRAVEIFQRAWTDGPRRAPEEVDPRVREQVRRMVMDGFPPSRDGQPRLDPPAIGRLAEIDAPTLAIVGDVDMLDILTIVDLIEEQVPGARKVVIPGAAHMVNMEAPEEINRLVRDFLLEQIEE
jgi:pimeloyl-ACP methyl ester carboxylesterase